MAEASERLSERERVTREREERKADLITCMGSLAVSIQYGIPLKDIPGDYRNLQADVMELFGMDVGKEEELVSWLDKECGDKGMVAQASLAAEMAGLPWPPPYFAKNNLPPPSRDHLVFLPKQTNLNKHIVNAVQKQRSNPPTRMGGIVTFIDPRDNNRGRNRRTLMPPPRYVQPRPKVPASRPPPQSYPQPPPQSYHPHPHLQPYSQPPLQSHSQPHLQPLPFPRPMEQGRQSQPPILQRSATESTLSNFGSFPVPGLEPLPAFFHRPDLRSITNDPNVSFVHFHPSALGM